MNLKRSIAVWAALVVCLAVPLVFAATSPLLQWRSPVYIMAGFAGVLAMAVLLLQPILLLGALPGLTPRLTRRFHVIAGGILTGLIVLHVVGLWITSAPDVVDALLFVSPTPFSAWGVVAMWAVFATTFLALMRRSWKLSPRMWRVYHGGLAVVIIGGSVVHALLIEGTMETLSKTFMCVLIVLAGLRLFAKLRIWNDISLHGIGPKRQR